MSFHEIPSVPTPTVTTGALPRTSLGQWMGVLFELHHSLFDCQVTDASKWVKPQLARTSNSKYRPSDKQKPNATVARANEKLAARFYQLKDGPLHHGTIPAVDHEKPRRQVLVV